SLSSELQTAYFCIGAFRGMKLHFVPVGNPAPPRPRRPEALTASMICSRGGFSARIRSQTWYPPIERYVSSVHGRSRPSGSNTVRFILSRYFAAMSASDAERFEFI